ncbi:MULTISPECIES: DUF6333 family protein [unclassified Streptomyces]|uniref:DUF6333 family protein n=1 Tax=unclassified Streptomyces TaxID=2593676 RepID=UPI002E30598B|nr:DUF6333 family protein [Streptomyces sp. NBC_01268]
MTQDGFDGEGEDGVDGIWTYPAEQELARYGEFRITVVEPPFPVGMDGLPAHDPERARELAVGLGTVDGVVAEVDRIEAVRRMPFATRADLDLVGIGHWGGLIEINDPALAFTGGDFPLAKVAEELSRRHPGAAVIGSTTVDHHATHHTHVIHHPDGTRLFASGWAGEGDWDLSGAPRDIAVAFGIGAAELAERAVELDAEPGDLSWEGLTRAVLRSVGPLPRSGRTLSVFRVRRDERTAGDLEETWID